MSTEFNYLEWVSDGASPATVGFTLTSGQSNEVYLLQNVSSINDLYAAFVELVGDVGTTNGARLTRTLPVRHPFMPFYCVAVSSFQGYGQPFRQISNPPLPFIPEISNYCLYENYRFNVNFQPVPYNILSDEVIGNDQAGFWFPENGTGTIEEEFTYAREWERFVDWEPVASDDNVTQQQGTMAFNAAGLPMDARPFLAQPRLYLNNEMIKFTWYNVPFQYINSDFSYLRRFRGRVNQSTWETETFGTYQPGELLYMGYKIKKYTPPFSNANYTIPGTGITEFQKNCDIEIMCMATRRELGALPLVTPTNKNYVLTGFNSQPYIGSANDPLTRTFLYANTTPSNGSRAVPLWLSFPIEILFSNPDAPDHI